MKTYTTFLLEDIKNAHRPDLGNADSELEMTFEEKMEAVEDYVTGRNIPPSLAQRCGLTPDQFPPLDSFNENELRMIIDAFQEMLFTWNIAADFPTNFPLDRAYPLLINMLNEEAWYMSGGMLHFDFCTGYAPDCELKEYCACKEYWKD